MPFPLAREILTRRDGALYLYGRRRLAEVLKRGEGIFWHRACNSRGELIIWLHARARVAATLGIILRGQETLTPLLNLVAGDVDHGRGRQAEANAALYASFHAGRVKPKNKNKLIRAAELASGQVHILPVNPISRGKLTKAAGISRYRQRSYERRAGVVFTRNFQIAEATDHTIGRALHQGVPVFKFTDHAGRFGPKGATYGARRLPNTYHAPHTIGPLFSKRTHKLNETADRLRVSAIDGNGNTLLSAAGHQPETFNRVFYHDGVEAMRAWERDGNSLYWQTGEAGATTFWRRLAPRKRE